MTLAAALPLDDLPVAASKPSWREKLSGVFGRAAQSARAQVQMVRHAISADDAAVKSTARRQLKTAFASAATGAAVMAATKVTCAAAFSCAAAPVALTAAGTAVAVTGAKLFLDWRKDRKAGTSYNFFSRENIQRNGARALMAGGFSLLGASLVHGLDSDLISARAQGIGDGLNKIKGALDIKTPALPAAPALPAVPTLPTVSDLPQVPSSPSAVPTSTPAPALAPVETRVVPRAMPETVARPAAPIEKISAPVSKTPALDTLTAKSDLSGRFSKSDQGIYARAKAWLAAQHGAASAAAPVDTAVPADAQPVLHRVITCEKVAKPDGAAIECPKAIKDVVVQPGDHIAVDTGTKIINATNGSAEPVGGVEFMRDTVAPFVLAR